MIKKNVNSEILENWDHLDRVCCGILVIDREFQILKANRYSGTVLGVECDDINPGDTCYKILSDRSERCDNCPVEAEKGQKCSERSFIFNRKGAGIYLREMVFPGEEVIFLTFQDNINEVFLKEEIDSIKNELIAKNVLLNRYRSGDNCSHELSRLIDNLPDTIVAVDNSMNVKMINSKAKLEFPEINVRKCYELLGNRKPCKSCPVKNKISDSQDLKTSHIIGGKFFTEIINGVKNEESCLLVFRDNTRQIDLIEQIRRQNETINRKNSILSTLVKLEIKMQRDKDINAVLEYFADIFLSLYNSDSIVIIVSDIRAGSVWFTLSRGVDDEKVNMLTQAYFSRDIHTVNPNSISQDMLPWPDSCQINLVGRTDKLVGMIFVKKGGAEDSNEIIDLFKDPIAAYLHNQILIKLLKEKANTDSLTGLYNRRFLQKVMEQEKSKLDRYGINHSVVVIDVNGLKYVNDKYGHDAGDNMITLVAENLNKSTRETDVVSRTGGDEFVILLTNTGADGAGKFLDRLKNRVFNQLYMELDDKQKHPVTMSTGIASTDSYPPDDLIKVADELMYEDKKEYYKKNKTKPR